MRRSIRRLAPALLVAISLAVPGTASADGRFTWSLSGLHCGHRMTVPGTDNTAFGYVEGTARINSIGDTGARRFSIRLAHEHDQNHDGEWEPYFSDSTLDVVTRYSGVFPADGQTRYFSTGQRFWYASYLDEHLRHRLSITLKAYRRNLLGQDIEIWSRTRTSDSCIDLAVAGITNGSAQGGPGTDSPDGDAVALPPLGAVAVPVERIGWPPSVAAVILAAIEGMGLPAD